MNHTCYKCGEPVDPDAAFCPNCRAPQIRVPEGDEPATPPLPPGTPGDVPPPARPIAPETQLSWRDALPAVAIAAAVLVIASLHVAFMAMFLVFAVSMLAMLFYRRRRPHAELSAGTAAKLGATIGFTFFFMILAAYAVKVSTGGAEEFRQTIDAAIAQAATQSGNTGIDPESMRGAIIAFGFLFLGAMLMSFFAIGAMFAAKLTRRR